LIDVNYAPSFGEVPNGGGLILRHILEGASQRFNRPRNNSVLLPLRSTLTRENTIVIFDVDGTITEHGKTVTDEFLQILQEMRKKMRVGVISGGTIEQMLVRLGGKVSHEHYDYIFCENSCQTYQGGKLIDPLNMETILTRAEIIEIINWSLEYIAKLNLPFKRGLFIDYREGLINISPSGRFGGENLVQLKGEWVKFDRENNIRQKMVSDMKEKFGAWNKLSWVVGGNSGFDVFPQNWDKSLVHRFTKNFENFFYFGDKTDPTLCGNDWPCFSHESTFGFSVKGPSDTLNIVKNLFF